MTSAYSFYLRASTLTQLDDDLSDAVNIYPNPSNGIVKVEFPQEMNGPATAFLFSLEGKIVEVFDLDLNSIESELMLDLGFLRGLYILKIQSGNRVISSKIKIVR